MLGFEAHSRVEIKLVFLGLTILVVLVMGTRKALGQREEGRGTVCWAQAPTEVEGPCPGLEEVRGVEGKWN